MEIIKETDLEEAMEEERRLFYVAMTRAREQLYIITEKNNQCRFIREIPTEYRHIVTNL